MCVCNIYIYVNPNLPIHPTSHFTSFGLATLFSSENEYVNKNLFVNVHNSFIDNGKKSEKNLNN